jgi:hypothetical protein|tara:strand:- start:2107 stop:2433 length:327 start_codon:yes stop_codon:yes gene_type:complete
MTDIAQAILTLDPTAQVSINAEDLNQITWHDGNPNGITAEQITAKQVELQDANDNDYSRKRREAYDAAGCTIEALAIATFESVFADDSSAAVKLQIEREKIREAIPKP